MIEANSASVVIDRNVRMNASVISRQARLCENQLSGVTGRAIVTGGRRSDACGGSPDAFSQFPSMSADTTVLQLGRRRSARALRRDAGIGRVPPVVMQHRASAPDQGDDPKHFRRNQPRGPHKLPRLSRSSGRRRRYRATNRHRTRGRRARDGMPLQPAASHHTPGSHASQLRGKGLGAQRMHPDHAA
jgi:hypothetical protein